MSRFVQFSAFSTDVPSDRQCQRTCLCIAELKKNLITQIFPRTVTNLAPFFPLECNRKRVQLLAAASAKQEVERCFFPLEGGCSLLLEN